MIVRGKEALQEIKLVNFIFMNYRTREAVFKKQPITTPDSRFSSNQSKRRIRAYVRLA